MGARERERRKRLRVSGGSFQSRFPHSFCMGLKHAPIGPNAIAAPFSNNNLFLATHLWVFCLSRVPQVLQNYVYPSTNMIPTSLKVMFPSGVLLATAYYSTQITFPIKAEFDRPIWKFE